ncbi:MAG: hypothetical protein ACOCXM_06480 [Myxococcota bacterium]
MLRRAALPTAIYVVAATVYVLLLGARAGQPSADNHYVHLAHSWLEGQLHVVGNEPHGTNDWACYDVAEQDRCPPNVYRFPADQKDRYRWYVSFPPLPAAVILPAVAVAGTELPDALFWALVAGLAPALLFVLLRFLSESGRSGRSRRDNLLLTGLFAFGTVFFFVAVQGTVWFAAQVVASVLLPPYLLWSIDARRPWLAGLALGLLFLTRPTTALLALFFGAEALRVSRSDDAPAPEADHTWYHRLGTWLAGVRWRPALVRVAKFSAPILVVGAVAMVYNEARFDDPFEFGHTYLQIRWRPRIEKWGLFNYHYLGRNLAVFLASLPWLTAAEPHLRIGRHGLALWVTTPNLLLLLWPKRVTPTMVGLYVGAGAVLVLNLLYQNTGWVQFGYRFALDYLPALFVLLALGQRRFGAGFWLLAAFAVALNTFGAATFDRAPEYYDSDSTQRRIFQPH